MNRARGLAIEISRRLIGKDDVGLVAESAGDGDTLLLSSRQELGRVVGAIGQADFIKQI